jgi:hypothetical protein
MNSAHTQKWNWHTEGFKFPPSEVRSPRQLTLYRVWGGTASEIGNPARPGVCLSFEAPTTRREAEGLFSVWEWGNSCRYVTTFQVAAGATIFVGRAHPGDFYQSGLGAPGSQVFIETAEMRRFVRKSGSAKELLNDMGRYSVVPNKDPGKHRSS